MREFLECDCTILFGVCGSWIKARERERVEESDCEQVCCRSLRVSVVCYGVSEPVAARVSVIFKSNHDSAHV